MLANIFLFLALERMLLASAQSQQQLLVPANDTFNSSFVLPQSERDDAGLNATASNNFEVVLNFERSRWATGSVGADDFYQVPTSSPGSPPGSLLKLQVAVNTSFFTLPPNTALSRILFQSETVNGTSVPASAYILWPYAPLQEPDGLPIVAFGHGTSGRFGECAPSHFRHLWYHWIVPYQLALNGYVVVAPDFIGLGVDKTANGSEIIHPYLNNPSHANDLIYAVQAAQKAFSSLSKRFVVMGHSQGGGAAWGAAERQAVKPVDGYLGAIAGSPVTNLSGLVRESGLGAVIGGIVGDSIASIYPEFNTSSLFTATGSKIYDLFKKYQTCYYTFFQIGTDPSLYSPSWLDDEYANKYFDLSSSGGKAIGGPMLVLQGTADESVPVNLTGQAFNQTCAFQPNSSIQYHVYEGTTHVPTMYASQRDWLGWIADRFANKTLQPGCSSTTVSSIRPYDEYQVDVNWFLEYATNAYQSS